MSAVEILRLPEHAHEQTPIGRRFRAVSDLVDRCVEAQFGPGSAHLSHTLALRMRRGSDAEAVVTLVALERAVPSGAADIFLPQHESTSTADTMIFVDPDLPDPRRASLFESLVEASISHARSLGRTTFLGGGVAAAEAEITAATGFGGVHPDDPESAAWIRRGAVLSQVYRSSQVALDGLSDLGERLRRASKRSEGYRAVTWVGQTPAERREDMLRLHERMSTDAPTGDLDLEPESWTDARLTEFEQHKTGGERLLLSAAVEHIASGRFVGYTQMLIGTDPVARQHNLIVLREHRGHGLGMLLKLAGLALLKDAAPHAERVSTMNAEENRHMIRVNEAVGFSPVAWTAVWQVKAPGTTMES